MLKIHLHQKFFEEFGKKNLIMNYFPKEYSLIAFFNEEGYPPKFSKNFHHRYVLNFFVILKFAEYFHSVKIEEF
jgi:hypothetical protein